MAAQWDEYLITIFQAVRRDPSGACVFAGHRLDEAPHVDHEETAAPGSDPPSGADEGSMLTMLCDAIYTHAYTRRFSGRLSSLSPLFEPQYISEDEFERQLSAANQSRYGWDPDWEICRIGAEHDVQVRKGDRYRTVPAGQYAFGAGPGMSPRTGDTVSLQVLRESFKLQQGFYFVFGETLGDQFDEWDRVRFYFNIDARGAAPLIELLTAVLNRFQVPFEFKCHQYQQSYARIDSAVLYIARRYSDIVCRLIRELSPQLQTHLRLDVPLFTSPILPGISVADDPRAKHSFGQNRCELVAATILDARRAGRDDPHEFIAALARRFESHGISWERPHLNPGNVEMFDAIVQAEFVS